jgi:hypothetical protein
MALATLVLQHLLPREAVSLGSFVRDVENPYQGVYKSPSLESYTESKDFSSTTGKNYKDLVSAQASAGAGAAVARVLRFGLKTESNKDNTLTTKKVQTYLLHDSDGKFDAIVGEEDAAKKWLEKSRSKGTSSYMVTGYQIISDAILKTAAERAHEGEASMKATDPNTGINAQLDVKGKIKEKTKAEFTAVNEQVYAVQYRKIRLNLLSSKDMDGARLEHKNRWQVFWKAKGAANNGVDDILEVDLVDTDLGDNYLSDRVLDTNEQIFYKALVTPKTNH